MLLGSYPLVLAGSMQPDCAAVKVRMLTPRFNDLWGSLTSTFHRYHRADRTAVKVVELAQIRMDLDDLRSDIAVERELIRHDNGRRDRLVLSTAASVSRIEGDAEAIRLAAFQQFPQQ